MTPQTKKKAKIHRSVKIGDYSIIESNVEIGERTIVDNFVIIKAGTKLGRNNHIHAGAQIGVSPQDYHYQGEKSECIIGDNNIIREYATISRATGYCEKTLIGSNNVIMTYVHIAHNVRIGDHTIIASGTQLGGYVEIGDHANVGGLTGVHQYCRIGRYAMLGAKSYLNKDLPPYTLAQGNRAKVYGINTKGLLRNKFTWQEIEELRGILDLFYRSSMNSAQIIKTLTRKNSSQFAVDFAHFLSSSKRGILAHR